MTVTPAAIQCALEAYRRRTGHAFAPKAALIDMDGVLYDSMPGHAKAWKEMTEEMGMTCDPDEFYLYEGMTGKATIALLIDKYQHRAATAEECKRLYARKTELFASYNQRPLMPGADRMLKALGAFGLDRVLVTGSGQGSLLKALALDYPGVFATGKMVTAADVRHGKPDAEPYLRGMDKAGCHPWQALVVENAPLGVESGHKAGAFVCAVATGPVPMEKLAEAGADLVFESMNGFADMLPILLHIASMPS